MDLSNIHLPLGEKHFINASCPYREVLLAAKVNPTKQPLLIKGFAPGTNEWDGLYLVHCEPPEYHDGWFLEEWVEARYIIGHINLIEKYRRRCDDLRRIL